MASTKEIIDKYTRKIEHELSSPYAGQSQSQEYLQFKREMIPETTNYEKWAKSLGSLVNIKVSEKDRERVQKFIETAHLDITSSQALTLSIISMLIFFFGSLLIASAIYIISSPNSASGILPNLALFVLLGAVASVFVFYYTYTMPKRLSNAWRLKASAQMVPAVLYTVVYMKHTSNLERAVDFASEHLEGPLALDFKKVFYDVEIGKFPTIKQSLDSYLEVWQDYAPEFVESFHLIESSLYEPSDSRRIEILEKALQVTLDGIYEKMLKYSREIRSPLTNVYMLGIILPTLGLALLPLASTLLGGILQWQHVFIIFNIIIPFFVFYMTSEILLKRPGGYGESSVLELNPDYSKFISKKPWFKAALIALPLLILGLLPFIFQIDFLVKTMGLQNDYKFSDLGISFSGFADAYLFDFKTINEKTIGPFGPIGIILSLFIPLGIALFFSTAYKLKTQELIKAREATKTLEEEFTNSLFQLGNRLGDGVPAEIAFAKVAESTHGQVTSSFFALVNQNIQQLGMSLDSAIFDKKRGAIIFYPSSLIATSMKILVETVKKGLQIAARALMSISDYVKNIQKINQRLRDLLAEVISDMRSNMSFLAPLLAGIVVGLSAMITLILNRLQGFQQTLSAQAGGEATGLGSFGAITKIFDLTTMIPPYFIQIIIGIYITEIVFILTSALVTVDSGKDKLREKYDLSKYLKRSIFIYLGTAFISTLALSLLAAIALSAL